jgi:NADP-dependent 3-hydroxy acid dehydrogenase YdfG
MNKTALTGATSGIGKTTAQLLAKNNYRIILCGRRSIKDKRTRSFTDVHCLHLMYEIKVLYLKPLIAYQRIFYHRCIN